MGSVGMHPTTGSRPSADILHRLVWEDNPEELRRTLLQYQDHYTHDEKTGAAIPFSDTRFRGTTALGLAAQLGRKGCINVLLEHWADTLEFSDLGYLPLQEATSLGDRDMMRSLLLRRHEQLQQLWKIRQPALSEALHSELPDFFLEMDWHFRSWIPFLARLCPSDTCRIWKRGCRLRVDSTLMGVEVEKLRWMRGNISFLFHVSDANSRFIILDHDRKLYEEVDKMKDFTNEEIEEDLNARLNTQIYSGKVRKPRDRNGEKRVQFVRQHAGLFGLGGEREERIGPYQTRVYDIPGVEVSAKYRKEHLVARERLKQESTPTPNCTHEVRPPPSSLLGGELASSEEASSLDSAEVLAEIKEAQPQVEHMIAEARKNLYVYVPSLPPPLPSERAAITSEEYFSASAPYVHVGRHIIQTEKSRKFRVSVWMADNFPLTVQQLLPFMEVIAMGNRNFEKVQEFISMDLPPGFPVRIEIPLLAFLAAQVTFVNFQFWRPTAPPTPTFAKGTADWFDVPAGYREGTVIKNILKDN